jgi:hypothetical protein
LASTTVPKPVRRRRNYAENAPSKRTYLIFCRHEIGRDGWIAGTQREFELTVHFDGGGISVVRRLLDAR